MGRPVVVAILASSISAMCSASAIAQGPALDPSAFAQLQLKTLSSYKSASERRTARTFAAQQIGALASQQRQAVSSVFLDQLGKVDAASKIDIASILAAYPEPWSTDKTLNDADSLYKMMMAEKDQVLKSALDSAIANAKGLYRDGISDFRVPKFESLRRAEEKLRTMAARYPSSRFAENASFYTALSITNQFITDDPRGIKLIVDSNKAFEDYLRRAAENKFIKTDFVAAGHFYRGLNSWIQNNQTEARKWMEDGVQKFSDNDSIYIYQVFLSPGQKDLVIDRFLPARSVFNITANHLRSGAGSYKDAESLAAKLRSL